MYTRFLTPLTASDGENLALYKWQPEDSTKLDPQKAAKRGLVLIVHGLGEHAGRYDHVAHRLQNWGFEVRAYDQRGHGVSGGKPGVIPTSTALLDDLADIVDDVRSHHLGLPLILLGHSLGGLLASRFVSLNIRPVDALVLSSPALDAGLSAFQKLLLKVLPRRAPDLCVGNGLDANYLSRDPKVVKAYLADRMVHNKISARLAEFIATAGPATLAVAGSWRTPTLLMYAGADKLVNPAGSATFARRASRSKSIELGIKPDMKLGTVTSKRFDGYYHELFNEVDAAPVFALLKSWLDARF